MNIIRLFACALVVLFAHPAWAQDSVCDFYLPLCAEKFERYNQEAKRINDDAQAKRITNAQAGDRIVALARSLFPKDALLANITAQQRTLAHVLSASSNLTKEQKDALEDSASAVFTQALSERFSLAQSASEMSSALQARAAAAPQYNAAPSSDTSVFAGAWLLNGIGKAFATSFGQSITPPPRICQYYGNTSFCQ